MPDFYIALPKLFELYIHFKCPYIYLCLKNIHLTAYCFFLLHSILSVMLTTLRAISMGIYETSPNELKLFNFLANYLIVFVTAKIKRDKTIFSWAIKYVELSGWDYEIIYAKAIQKIRKCLTYASLRVQHVCLALDRIFGFICKSLAIYIHMFRYIFGALNQLSVV